MEETNTNIRSIHITYGQFLPFQRDICTMLKFAYPEAVVPLFAPGRSTISLSDCLWSPGSVNPGVLFKSGRTPGEFLKVFPKSYKRDKIVSKNSSFMFQSIHFQIHQFILQFILYNSGISMKRRSKIRKKQRKFERKSSLNPTFSHDIRASGPGDF